MQIYGKRLSFSLIASSFLHAVYCSLDWKQFIPVIMQATPQDALRVETDFLRRFDYAWNLRQAGCEARHVNIMVSQYCCSRSTRLVCRPARPPAVNLKANAAKI